MITTSNGAVMTKSPLISSLKEFEGVVQGNGFSGFINSDLENKHKEQVSSLALAAQIGGSGIQVGVTGLKPSNEVSIFKLPSFSDTDAKANYSNLEVLSQIIGFVSDYAKKLGQTNCDIDIGVAGFEALKPPENIGIDTKKKAADGKLGEYFTPNVLFDSGNGARNFFNPADLLKYATANSRASTLISESGILSENNFRINGSILNDTVTLACSHTEGLEKGDSSVGVVCGTGFNMGIARGFNGIGFDDLRNANLELGHWKIDPDKADFLNPFDVPFVNDRTILNLKDRAELIKKKTPEILFSGSNEDEVRSIKNILINIKDLLAVPDQEIKGRAAMALNSLGMLLGVEHTNYPTIIGKAREAIKGIESKSKKTINQLTDLEIEAFASNQTAEESSQHLISNLYSDYFYRLGKFIGQTLERQGIKSPKAINFTGSYFVEPMKKMPAAKKYFAQGLAENSTEPRITKINLSSREEMDGMAAMIKTKANAESKRRIETFAAMAKAAI